MSQAIRITLCSVLLSWSAVANFFFRSAFCSVVRLDVSFSNQRSIDFRSTCCSTSPALVEQRHTALSSTAWRMV